jgi:hypothetical protein
MTQSLRGRKNLFSDQGAEGSYNTVLRWFLRERCMTSLRCYFKLVFLAGELRFLVSMESTESSVMYGQLAVTC